jgi:hypothetical protein
VHFDDAGLLGGATGEAHVGQPLPVSVPVKMPVVVLYVSERATYMLLDDVHDVGEALWHAVTAAPVVALPDVCPRRMFIARAGEQSSAHASAWP